MSTKPNLKRIRDVLNFETTDEVEEIASEDEESNSDPDFSLSESKSDDTSTDERISENDSSSDSFTSNNDLNLNFQPDTVEKQMAFYGREKAPTLLVVYMLLTY
ncbi:unnamed protein product [Adineta ricciae]|uniref:Uncharacterized protein n=1 Tax=Adineta ricciae TaxID=249248 RepID=A0A815MZI1_ADIRI|nr:unnamed protein product [Adineta ricciae]CAF1464789.1 unnamed protein product [Adineta ricciae]